jgi:site-specific recombinase XerD
MTSFRQRMTEDMQIRNLSSNAQTSYLQQVTLFARYCKQSPELLGSGEIRSYQLYVTNERKLAVGSILIAIAALRFLYKITLKRDWDFTEIIPAPKKAQTPPLVLSPKEVLHFLGCIASPKHHAILSTCYAAGQRISEAVRLTKNWCRADLPLAVLIRGRKFLRPRRAALRARKAEYLPLPHDQTRQRAILVRGLLGKRVFAMTSHTRGWRWEDGQGRHGCCGMLLAFDCVAPLAYAARGTPRPLTA